LAFSEIMPDEKGGTCAALLERADAYFASKRVAPDRAGDGWQ
jgi:hypothetical protein